MSTLYFTARLNGYKGKEDLKQAYINKAIVIGVIIGTAVAVLTFCICYFAFSLALLPEAVSIAIGAGVVSGAIAGVGKYMTSPRVENVGASQLESPTS
ncbi:magnesium transporter [Wolbachia endosymbiont of Ctenocephalides felis wCfeT]|uniref:magnesium transporter n=1 Tax=Wolbachia endosymbiont of Ctenocephalides felis wCfeT TaxID=2732593 RepID=UPI0014462B4D|nr:magnesium transporter [Wolbachia endosymbiont of Ctenocephalides felis wCfeT]